jgi:hypothetical protein
MFLTDLSAYSRHRQRDERHVTKYSLFFNAFPLENLQLGVSLCIFDHTINSDLVGYQNGN